MFHHFKLICVSLLTATLCACGGSGSSSAPAAESSSNQLAGSVKISGYTGLSLAQKKITNGTQTASLHKLLNWVTDAIFPKAYAQAAGQCNYDLLKLAGVTPEGSLDELTTTTTNDCTSGFIDMYDGKKYILLTASGIYKDGLTCNLVLINKSNGSMYCVGERSRSIYKISGVSTWRAYEKLQVSDNGDYMFLETDSTVFDQNGQITGVKTKLLRFDLTSDTVGPVSNTIVEGFQQTWLSAYTGTNASEYEGFEIKGYQGLDNGDLAILYQRSFSTSNNSSTKLNAYYYAFEADGTYRRVRFDDATIDAELTSAYNSAGSNNNNSSMHWYDISCFFKDPSDTNAFVFTIPYWVTYTANNQTFSSSVMKALILRGTKPSSNDITMPVQMINQQSAICSESSGMMPGMSGSSTRPTKIGNTFYAIQSINEYIPSGNNYSWGQRVYLVANAFDNLPDTRQLISDSSANNGWWSWGTKLFASKDFLYLQQPSMGVMWTTNSQPGDTLWKINPRLPLALTNGRLDQGSYQEVISSNEYISITKVATSKTDNVLKITGRDNTDPDLGKIIGSIDESGSFTRAPSNNSTLQPISIVKL